MIQVGFADSPARTAPPANGCFGANWPAPLIGCSWPILLKNSKMHSLHFLAKLSRDRQFAL
jgi:hypothetical protein